MIKKINFPELKDNNFIIIPIPFKDELLSSWIVRTAYAHKTHPHTFTNQYLNYRHHSFFSSKCDVTLDEEMISAIENKSYHKVNVHDLTLNTYSGFIQENIYENSPNTFFTHLKYCPVCLREDKTPYFRKKWKVIFYNICHKHQCYLYEHCPKCKTRLDVSKMHNNELPYTFCYKCGFELKKARKQPIHKQHISSLDYQNKIFKVLHDGYIQLDNTPIYSFLFIEIFAKFSKLILINKKHKFIEKHPIFTLINHVKPNSLNHPICKRINSKEQSSFFGLIMYIFDNYPYNLKRFILENELTYYNMTTKLSDIPFWYETILNEISPQYVPHSMTVTKEEVTHAEKYLRSIGKEINKVNLTRLLGCNFNSNDNNLKSYI